MSDVASGSNRRYWSGVAAYVVVLLLAQSLMGLGIDKFKEIFGTGALEVLAYAIVGVGAGGVAWTGWTVWGRCSFAERTWIGLALVIYGVGTLSARNPQERLHYLGYGVLAALLYVGFVRPRRGIVATATGPGFVPVASALLIGSLIGYADELLQILWPRRYFDWADVAMNVVAVALGLLVAVPAWNALGSRR